MTKCLSVVTLLIVAAAAALLLRQVGTGRPEGAGRQVSAVGAAPTTVPSLLQDLPTALPLELASPTPAGQPHVRGRGQAIDIARTVAANYREANPELITAALLPYSAAVQLVKDPRVRPEDGSPPAFMGWTPDTKVWVVRMWGSFRPPMGPNAETAPPVQGWMFALIDPETGWPLHQGYNPNTVPLP